MCGIAGRSGLAPMPVEHAEALARELQHVLHRRGPDGGGVHHDGDLLLVHRRLSIIDISENGLQPLWNEDRTVCVIVNGEIYNFQRHRRELLSRGHRFRSGSDSEVIVHLYEECGIDRCAAQLDGMFAFALWDARTRDLYLVRDRLGIKPLVLARHEGGVTFASSLPALLADPSVPDTVSSEALLAVFKWGFVPAPSSAIQAARRVTPGSVVHIRGGRIVGERRWWTDEMVPETIDDRQLREALADAVSSHLVADVPVGALLSAGIDSGLVTALSARGDRGERIEAWTVSQAGHPQDEYPDASRAAKHFDIRLHEMALGDRGLSRERFRMMIDALDEPLVDTSLIGLHAMYEAISADRRVVLSGDGGDELFGGYDWHVGMPGVPSWGEHPAFHALAPALSRFAGASGRAGAVGAVARRVLRDPADVYLDKLRLVSDERLQALKLPRGHEETILAPATEMWERFAPRGVLEQMLAVERRTRLVDQMLAKVDSASMHHSVEARVPLLAQGVLSAAKGLPSQRKRRDGVGKLALRDWYAELAPPGLAARAKTGFDAPVEHWVGGAMREPLAELATEGLRLLGATRIPLRAVETFALATVASWEGRIRGQRLQRRAS